MGMEIERKFLVKTIPENLESYPVRYIEQAYLNFSPAVRIRKDVLSGTAKYELTYKGHGLLAHTEYNMPLDETSYENLKTKTEGLLIKKKRYMIPVDPYTAELDVFEGELDGTVIVEVEFPTEDEEDAFIPPEWFGEDVTESGIYSNSHMAKKYCK